MLFVPGNDLVQELAAAASDPALRETILPGCLYTRALRFEPGGFEEVENFPIELRIMIQNYVPVGIGFREGFPQLLHDPRGSRMASDMEMQDSPPLVLDDEKAVQDLKRQGGHGEEVHRHNGFSMIGQEGPPAFAGIAVAPNALKIAGYGAFGNVEAELPQFAVNFRRSPVHILRRHPPNESPQLFLDPRSPTS